MKKSKHPSPRSGSIAQVLRRTLGIAVWVVALAVALWTLVAGWGGRVDPRSWWLPAVTVLSYPLAVLAAGVLAAVLALARCWCPMAVVLATLLATWPALRVNVPVNVGRSAAAASTSDTFTLLTYNVQGFGGDADSLNATMRYILDTDADLVLLQEASLGPKDFTDLPSVAPMRDEIYRRYPYHSHGYHDLIILSRWPYTVLRDTTLRQGFGSPDNISREYHFYAKAFDIDMPGRQLRVVNLHLQSIGLTDEDKKIYHEVTQMQGMTDRDQLSQVKGSLLSKLVSAFRRRADEAHQLRAILDECPANLVVCGDFNDVPASYAYWTVRGSDLRDAWADAAFGPTYTYNRDLMLFKIDHVLYRGALHAVDIARHKAGSSDHYPQRVTFGWTKQPAEP